MTNLIQTPQNSTSRSGCITCSTTNPMYPSKVCPDTIKISPSFGKMTVTFLGATKGRFSCDNGNAGTTIDCGAASTYLTQLGLSQSVIVDPWKAYKDGMWSSSVDITVQHQADTSCVCLPGGCGLTDSISFTYQNTGTAITSFLFTAVQGLGCPSHHCCTLTIFDDGSASVA